MDMRKPYIQVGKQQVSWYLSCRSRSIPISFKSLVWRISPSQSVLHSFPIVSLLTRPSSRKKYHLQRSLSPWMFIRKFVVSINQVAWELAPPLLLALLRSSKKKLKPWQNLFAKWWRKGLSQKITFDILNTFKIFSTIWRYSQVNHQNFHIFLLIKTMVRIVAPTATTFAISFQSDPSKLFSSSTTPNYFCNFLTSKGGVCLAAFHP